MSERMRRVPVATVVAHDGCWYCEWLAAEVRDAALRHYHGDAAIAQKREKSHFARAILPARIEWWEEYSGGWVRAEPPAVSEPATTLGTIARDLNARADRLQEEAWDALANEDYDEMRRLEARAQGLRQAARIVRGERRDREQ